MPGNKLNLRPYFAIYGDAYGEYPVGIGVSRLSKAIKSLLNDREDPKDEDEVKEYFEAYCSETPLRYYSAERFAETYSAWGPPDPSQMVVTKDLAIRRGFDAGLRGVDVQSIPAAGFPNQARFKKWLDLQLAKQDEEEAYTRSSSKKPTP